MYFSTLLSYASLASLISLASACESCSGSGSKLHRREEHGGGEVEFTYLGLTGPVDWVQFGEKCGNGRVQSPINVVSTMHVSAYGDVGEYADIGAPGFNFTNTGHTVEVFYKGQTAILGGVEYELQRFHFHTPSEHRLDDEWFALEVHFVHQAKADPNHIAVVGIFIDINDENRSDPMMSRLASLLPSIENKGETVVATHVPLHGVRTAITGAKKFTYTGSLTTPPCTEGVSWYVSNTVLDVSMRDYRAFKNVMKYNSRNLQADPGQQNVVEFAAQFLNGSSTGQNGGGNTGGHEKKRAFKRWTA
ncbi:Nectarin-2 [Dactylella cylindrospora]|nr:Nectarin-2 [Dactylella cylindrospora]